MDSYEFADVVMYRALVFPVEQIPTVDWLAPVKEYLAATGRPIWRAYTDGSWIPLALLPTTLFATSHPRCLAGARIVLSPATNHWETTSYCCIEITEGAT